MKMKLLSRLTSLSHRFRRGLIGFLGDHGRRHGACGHRRASLCCQHHINAMSDRRVSEVRFLSLHLILMLIRRFLNSHYQSTQQPVFQAPTRPTLLVYLPHLSASLNLSSWGWASQVEQERPSTPPVYSPSLNKSPSCLALRARRLESRLAIGFGRLHESRAHYGIHPLPIEDIILKRYISADSFHRCLSRQFPISSWDKFGLGNPHTEYILCATSALFKRGLSEHSCL